MPSKRNLETLCIRLERIGLKLIEQNIIDVSLRESLIQIFDLVKSGSQNVNSLKDNLSQVAYTVLKNALGSGAETISVNIEPTSQVSVFITRIEKKGNRRFYTIYVPTVSIINDLSPGESAAAFLFELGLCYTDVKYNIYRIFKVLDFSLKTSTVASILYPILSTFTKVVNNTKLQLGSTFLKKGLISVIAIGVLSNFFLFLYNVAIPNKTLLHKDKALIFVTRTGLIAEYLSYYNRFKRKFHELVVSNEGLVDTITNFIVKQFGRIFVPPSTGYPIMRTEHMLRAFLEHLSSKQIESASQLTEKEKEILLTQINYLIAIVKGNKDAETYLNEIISRITTKSLSRLKNVEVF